MHLVACDLYPKILENPPMISLIVESRPKNLSFATTSQARNLCSINGINLRVHYNRAPYTQTSSDVVSMETKREERDFKCLILDISEQWDEWAEIDGSTRENKKKKQKLGNYRKIAVASTIPILPSA